jgi:molybdate transport system substrate-binding protein
LFEHWGIAEQIKPRIVVPPPGTPVGSLVASGQVALGFQQLSELISVDGLDVVGHLPSEVAYITTFSSGIPMALAQDPARQRAVQQFLEFLASAEVEPVKREQGMHWVA